MTILVIDDEKDMLNGVRKILLSADYKCMTADSGKTGLELINNHYFDAILCDLFLPDIDGFQILEEAKLTQPETPVIIFSAYGTIERAVEAMKTGAFDFLPKPFEGAHLLMLIKRAIEYKHLKTDRKELLKQLKQREGFDELVGHSKQLHDVLSLIEKVAPSDANVLITGESGTGKELIARAIHNKSKRCDKVFVPINCGAFPENLFEAELFGYEKGAFTGAEKQKIGLLEFADQGSFFFDEVLEMPRSLQVKMLRVLQDRRLRRLGGNKQIDVDLRVISATNKNVTEGIKSGEIREDFYFRLNVVNIEIPPLRKRIDDIRLLAEHFLQKAMKTTDKVITEIDENVLRSFESYPWPGNVRELENVISRAVVLCRGKKITFGDIPPNIFSGGTAVNFSNITLPEAKKNACEKIERDYILHHLKLYNGNISRIAKISGMTRRNLHRICNKLDINPNDWRK